MQSIEELRNLETEALRNEIISDDFNGWVDICERACPESESIKKAEEEIWKAFKEYLSKPAINIYEELDYAKRAKNERTMYLAYFLGKYNNDLVKAVEVFNRLFKDDHFSDNYKEVIGNVVDLKSVT